MKNLTIETLNKMSKKDLVKLAKTENKKLTKIELIETILKNQTVSSTNEINIRSQKISEKFQRFMIVANMLKDGFDRLDIVDRLMSENGIYAGTDKAMSEKSTKNFVGKVTSCYNGLVLGGTGKVAYEMGRLASGKDVSKNCTFKSYARLTYKALK